MIYLQQLENHIIIGITIPRYTLYDMKQVKFGYNSNHAVFWEFETPNQITKILDVN